MQRVVYARTSIASLLLALTVLAAAAAMLSACNTVAGFGEDMNAAGAAITNSSEKTKNAM